MAKQLNMTIRLKNISDNTVAVANTIVSPKATVPVKVKKSSHIESVLLNHQQGKIEVLSPKADVLAQLVGFDLGEDPEVDEKPEGDKEPEGDKPDVKKPTPKKTVKKPAPKKEEDEQPNLLNENV